MQGGEGKGQADAPGTPRRPLPAGQGSRAPGPSPGLHLPWAGAAGLNPDFTSPGSLVPWRIPPSTHKVSLNDQVFY